MQPPQLYFRSYIWLICWNSHPLFFLHSDFHLICKSYKLLSVNIFSCTYLVTEIVLPDGKNRGLFLCVLLSLIQPECQIPFFGPFLQVLTVIGRLNQGKKWDSFGVLISIAVLYRRVTYVASNKQDFVHLLIQQIFVHHILYSRHLIKLH